MTNLTDLSREIAATSDKWMVPGVRCVDPGTGAAWRMTAAMAYGWAPDNATAYGDLENEDSLQLALATGPDLTDPATRGCLLELVREAWGEPQAFAMCALGMWFMRGPARPLYLPTVGCDSEAAALVAALEAAKEIGCDRTTTLTGLGEAHE